MNGYQAGSGQAVFAEDVYLYDLNKPASAPLAFRCARGGEEKPVLLEALGISARQWVQYEQKLYDMPLCTHQSGGAVVLPVFGSIGRLAIVVKPIFSVATFANLVQSAWLGAVYAIDDFADVPVRIPDRESEAAEHFASTVARLRLLVDWCCEAKDAGQIEDCISLACELWGVDLMPLHTVELAPLQGQVSLPGMSYSGQALAVSLMTLLSVMRNDAHARSGWLYVSKAEQLPALQAAFRMASDCQIAALERLKELLENTNVIYGVREESSGIKPLRQYAYLHKKITDPQHPYCARCGCLDKRCATCMAVQWAVMPYVCDAALLGIKNYFSWSE